MTTITSGADVKSLLRDATAQIRELRTQVSRFREPVAVVGIGCRLPGAKNPAELWDLLSRGVDATGEIPPERWNVGAYYDEDPDKKGRMYAKRGGFLREIDKFDPHFFGVSPREAANTDPQQRLLLEVAWEALEDAGVAKQRKPVTPTGVFFGLSCGDYTPPSLLAHDYGLIDIHALTGNADNAAAGRISFAFGFDGPNMAIDTACSSSLVCVHLACKSIQRGECDQALAGGVNLILSPANSIALSRNKVLSPDGRCKTFDDKADGMARAEGCVVLVLKRLSSALRDHDAIYAMIRGSAVNHDGPTSGFTVPSGSSQKLLLRAALADAGLTPADIQYIEAHGTATSLGDPIELGVIQDVFGAARPSGSPLYLGSIKTNIGHTEAAAGAAGLLKLILALRHQSIPPHLHFKTPTSRFDWDSSIIRVPTEAISWHSTGAARIGGVSSFGFSGTNAHVIVEEAPVVPSPRRDTDRPRHLLALSAKSPAALRALALQVADDLAQHREHACLGDVCYTLNTGRPHHELRYATHAATPLEMERHLRAFAAETAADGVAAGKLGDAWTPIFLFDGEEVEIAGTGRQLSSTSALFRAEVARCEALFRRRPHLASIELLPARGDAPSRHPSLALFALEYALARLWLSFGIVPRLSIGGGVGEYVAACLAEVFSLEDAVALVAARERVAGCTPADSMANAEAVAEFRKTADKVAYRRPRGAVVSSLTGRVEREVMACAEYWVTQLHDGGGLYQALTGAIDGRTPAFIGIGSGLTLLSLASQACAGRSALYLPSLRSGADDWAVLLESLATLYVNTDLVDWKSFDADAGRRKVSGLPTYPFQRESCWAKPPIEQPAAMPTRAGDAGGLLGDSVPLATTEAATEWRYTRRLSAHDPAFLADHALGDTVILPAAAMLEILFEAGRRHGQATIELRDLEFLRPLAIPADGAAVTIQTVMRRDAHGECACSIYSLAADGGEAAWSLHAKARLSHPGAHAVDGGVIPESDAAMQAAPVDWYETDRAYKGVRLGPKFQVVQRVRRAAEILESELALPKAADVGGSEFAFHPVLMDGGFQTVAAFLSKEERARHAYLPLAATRVVCYCSPRAGRVFVRAEVHTVANGVAADIFYLDEDRRVLCSVEGLVLFASDRQSRPQCNLDEAVYTVTWQEAHRTGVENTGFAQRRTWLVCADAGTVAVPLVRQLRDAGQDVVIFPDDLGRVGGGGDRLAASGAEDLAAVEAAIRKTFAAQEEVRILYLRSLETGSDTPPQALSRHVAALLLLLQALQRVAPSAATLWLLGRNAWPIMSSDAVVASEQAPLWALLEVAMSEIPGLRAFFGDLGAGSMVEISAFLRDLAEADYDELVAYRGNLRFVGRLAPLESAKQDPEPLPERFKVALRDIGLLDWLGIVPEQRRAPRHGELEIEVHATALNFKDALLALGVVSAPSEVIDGNGTADLPIGFECAGRVLSVGGGVTSFAVGDEVIAVQPGSLRSHIRVDQSLVHRKPAGLSFGEAASIPTAFLTSYYGLVELAKLKRGESVLIHAAAGGVGLAALSLAQSLDAEIYATASPGKWGLLRALGVKHVMNSRNLDFAETVMSETSGRGVDVVLNCLAGDFIAKSFAVLAPGGRFLEIGKSGVWSREEASAARPDVAYHAYDLGEAIALASESGGDMLRHLLASIERKSLSPLPTTVLPVQKVVQAFRHLAQGHNIGKVVIAMPPLLRPTARRADATIYADATYLITGGLGGLGSVTAEWLARQGARHLLLIDRHSPSPDQLAWISSLESRGLRIITRQVDVGDAVPLADTLMRLPKDLPAIRGVFHAAGVLDDGLLLNQSAVRVEEVLRPKVAGAWNLHQALRDARLDLFIMFSSAAALIGGPGQGSYAVANAFLDSFARSCFQQGLPALSVAWSAWEGTGMVARMSEIERSRLAAKGVLAVERDEGAGLLAALTLGGGHVPASVFVFPANWEAFSRHYNGRTPWFLHGRVTAPSAAIEPAASVSEAASVSDDVARRLAKLSPGAQREALEQLVLAEFLRVTGFDAQTAIEPKRTLFDLGLDSLMAVELRNQLQAGLAIALPTTLLFEYPTIAQLADYLGKTLFPCEDSSHRRPSEGSAPRRDKAPATLTAEEIAQLSEEEVEALMLERLSP